MEVRFLLRLLSLSVLCGLLIVVSARPQEPGAVELQFCSTNFCMPCTLANNSCSASYKNSSLVINLSKTTLGYLLTINWGIETMVHSTDLVTPIHLTQCGPDFSYNVSADCITCLGEECDDCFITDHAAGEQNCSISSTVRGANECQMSSSSTYSWLTSNKGILSYSHQQPEGSVTMAMVDEIKHIFWGYCSNTDYGDYSLNFPTPDADNSFIEF